jgi:hypothetical protein
VLKMCCKLQTHNRLSVSGTPMGSGRLTDLLTLAQVRAMCMYVQKPSPLFMGFLTPLTPRTLFYFPFSIVFFPYSISHFPFSIFHIPYMHLAQFLRIPPLCDATGPPILQRVFGAGDAGAGGTGTGGTGGTGTEGKSKGSLCLPVSAATRQRWLLEVFGGLILRRTQEQAGLPKGQTILRYLDFSSFEVRVRWYIGTGFYVLCSIPTYAYAYMQMHPTPMTPTTPIHPHMHTHTDEAVRREGPLSGRGRAGVAQKWEVRSD